MRAHGVAAALIVIGAAGFGIGLAIGLWARTIIAH